MITFLKKKILDVIYGSDLKPKISNYLDINVPVCVPPRMISRFIISGWALRFSAPRNRPDRVRLIGAVISGIWDLFSYKITKSNKYRDFQLRYKKLYPWYKTQQPLSFDLMIRAKSVGRGNSKTFEEFEYNVLHRWDQLYAEIRSNGYKCAEELGLPLSNNIEVAIGRSGGIYLVDGKHRLIMAQLLNLDYVPVVVNVIHKNFYNKLQRESGSSSIISLLNKKFNNHRRQL